MTDSVWQRPAISLTELVEEAELLTRVDRKYLVPRTELPAVLDGLPDGTRVLEIDGRRTFAYRSAYFDTAALHSYLAAARGRRHRFKLRIRSYLDSDQHYFEVKTRGSKGTTTKQRIPYGNEPTLSPAATAYAAEVLGMDLDLEHMLTTRYRRQTFLLPTGGARLTVDTRLTWQLPDGLGVNTPDWAVVETKSMAGTSAADRLLWSLHHRPRVVSKYGTGLAALRPDLPANRWHPVLRIFPSERPSRGPAPPAVNPNTYPALAGPVPGSLSPPSATAPPIPRPLPATSSEPSPPPVPTSATNLRPTSAPVLSPARDLNDSPDASKNPNPRPDHTQTSASTPSLTSDLTPVAVPGLISNLTRAPAPRPDSPTVPRLDLAQTQVRPQPRAWPRVRPWRRSTVPTMPKRLRSQPETLGFLPERLRDETP